jgi:hypothetical protein
MRRPLRPVDARPDSPSLALRAKQSRKSVGPSTQPREGCLRRPPSCRVKRTAGAAPPPPLCLAAFRAVLLYEPPRDAGPEQHIDVDRPGDLVGIDCFYVRRAR